MLMGALICMFVAAAILAVSVCFSKKNKTLYFLLQTLSLIALVCLGLVAGNYKNNFSGYTIFLILAIIPQFISLFDLSEYLKTKAIKTEENTETNIEEITEIVKNVTENISEENVSEENFSDAEKKKKRIKTPLFKQQWSSFEISCNGDDLDLFGACWCLHWHGNILWIFNRRCPCLCTIVLAFNNQKNNQSI